jgi:glycosylphosphatidylinositol transamidase (GPIT) subunit GPI8
MVNHFRKLNTNKNSRIIISIAAHGGENFIKFRAKSVVLTEELNRTLWEMYHKQRYKEILFIVDTCEGESLFYDIDIPNIYFVTSSKRDQKASSYSFDYKFMTPTVDRMHFKLFEYLNRIFDNKNFNIPINSIFHDFQTKEKSFITSDVIIKNSITREILFSEFFGNYLIPDNKVILYDYNISTKSLITNDFGVNNLLSAKRQTFEAEVDKYNQMKKTVCGLKLSPDDEDAIKVLIIRALISLFLLYLIILLLKH